LASKAEKLCRKPKIILLVTLVISNYNQYKNNNKTEKEEVKGPFPLYIKLKAIMETITKLMYI